MFHKIETATVIIPQTLRLDYHICMPSDARTDALETLGLIGTGRVLPKEALSPLEEALSRRDRAFLMELVYGVLRHKGLLDHLISEFVNRPPRSRTADNLRLAVYQIFFTRVPERAAVNESVNLEKSSRGGSPALVNAVLRNVVRSKKTLEEELARLKADAESPAAGAAARINAISTLTSHPRWLIGRWIRRFGAEDALALARADNRIPPLVLRVNTIKKTREETLRMLSREGIKAAPTAFSPAGVKIGGGGGGGGESARRVAFRDIEFIHPVCTAQDEAAQLAGFLLAPRPGEKILDACAAPGGKTTHIAELMKDSGHITAADIDPGRLQKLRENLTRLGLRSVSAVEADITDEGGPVHARPGYFDRVLIDAPCSSLGVIRRNPDVKYRHSEKELAGFGARQLRMLFASARALKTGGALVYSTCSTEPEEGEMVIRGFLEAMKGCFAFDEDVPPYLRPLMSDGFLRTYPHRQDMDGFFMAKLKKLC